MHTDMQAVRFHSSFPFFEISKALFWPRNQSTIWNTKPQTTRGSFETVIHSNEILRRHGDMMLDPIFGQNISVREEWDRWSKPLFVVLFILYRNKRKMDLLISGKL